MNTHILHTCHRVTNLQSQDSSNMWLTQYFGGINAGLLTSLSFYNKKHTLRDSSISSIQSIRHSRHHQLQHPQFRGQPHTLSRREPWICIGKTGQVELEYNPLRYGSLVRKPRQSPRQLQKTQRRSLQLRPASGSDLAKERVIPVRRMCQDTYDSRETKREGGQKAGEGGKAGRWKDFRNLTRERETPNPPDEAEVRMCGQVFVFRSGWARQSFTSCGDALK